jgi:hypothetical protein
MKVISKVVLAVLVGGLVTFGVGCGQEGLPAGKSPEDVIKEALLNQKEFTKSVYEVNVNADVKGDVDGEKSDLKGTASIKGSSSTDTQENSINLAVDGKMNTEAVKANIEVRANKDGVFMNLGKLEFSNKDTQDMADLFAADYKGKWTKLSFAKPSDINASGTFEIDYAQGDVLPFKNIEYKGTKDVLGVKSYLFNAKVDNALLLQMLEKKGTAAGAEQFLKDSEITAEIYTAVAEKTLTGFGMNIKMNQTEMNGTLYLQFMINPTKANAVETPKYDKEITEQDLANMFGGGSVAPTDTTDTSTYPDVEGYTDEELDALMNSTELPQ